MFVQIEALHVDGDAPNYEAIGINTPEEFLSFKPLWINLATVTHFEEAGSNPQETILSFTNNKNIQINMSEENFLILLDAAGMLPDVTQAVLNKAA